MRKFKLIFYLFYFGYFFVSIYFALYIDSMFKQFGMFPFLRFLKFWIISGMSLLLIEWIIENIHIYQLRRNNKKLEAEVVHLKAELYNFVKPENKEITPKNSATTTIPDEPNTNENSNLK